MKDLQTRLMLIHNNYESFLTRLKQTVDSMKREIEEEVNPIMLSGYGDGDVV
jgi:hypothetical protein